MRLGDWIRTERKEKFPSQHTYAAYINISQTTVSLWENNKLMPSITQLAVIAKSFGKSLKEIPFEIIENLESEEEEKDCLKLIKLRLHESKFNTADGNEFHLKGIIGMNVSSGEVKVIKARGADIDC